MRELILYIAGRCESDPGLGESRLSKLLFFCDFLSYRIYGKAITGHTYQALARGPAPTRLAPIRQQLVADGDLVIVEKKLGDEHREHRQQRVIALREANLSLFTAQEMDLIHNVVDVWWDSGAETIGAFSRGLWGWQLAEQGETIPYEVILIGRREPSPAETKYGLELEELARISRSE